MNSTFEGIRIDFNPEERKALFSIRFKLQPFSNITSFRDLQSEKHSSPMNSTVDGIRIDFNPEQVKASFSIRFKLQPLSNITSSRDLQP
jgi:hypothetical protein